MSKGKYYSLEEALKKDDVKGFAKAHPSQGDKQRFDKLLNVMATKKPPKDDQTSS